MVLLESILTLSRFKNAPLIKNLDFSVKKKKKKKKNTILKQQTRKAFICACKKSSFRTTSKLLSDAKVWYPPNTNSHCQGPFSKIRTRLLIKTFLNSRSLLITWWQYFENGISRHYFSKATVIVDVFWAKYLLNDFFYNFVVYKHVSVVYFRTNFFEISTSWHWRKHLHHYSKGSAVYL